MHYRDIEQLYSPEPGTNPFEDTLKLGGAPLPEQTVLDRQLIEGIYELLHGVTLKIVTEPTPELIFGDPNTAKVNTENVKLVWEIEMDREGKSQAAVLFAVNYAGQRVNFPPVGITLTWESRDPFDASSIAALIDSGFGEGESPEPIDPLGPSSMEALFNSVSGEGESLTSHKVKPIGFRELRIENVQLGVNYKASVSRDDDDGVTARIAPPVPPRYLYERAPMPPSHPSAPERASGGRVLAGRR